MRLHILVEGPSEEAFLQHWLPRFLPSHHVCKIIRHRGKGTIPSDPVKKPDPKRQGLLDQLPAKLRAFAKVLKSDTDRIVVLVDQDDDSCVELKNDMTNLLTYCHPPPTVVFRIAIEETEAFYLGDETAIRNAFPGAKLNRMSSYVQDSVCGTWELFQKVIDEDHEDKVGWARRIGPHLTTSWRGSRANKSVSFRHFCKALLRIAGEPID